MYRRVFRMALILCLCMNLIFLSGCNSEPNVPKKTDFSESSTNDTVSTEEPIHGLKADDGYGFIAPYLASKPDFMSCGPLYGSYGFIDASGRAVTDPVYQYIDALCVEDGYDFESCVWRLAQGEVQADAWDSYHSYLANARYGLAKGDGSVVIDPVYNDIEVLGNRIFAKTYSEGSYEIFDVDIYDFTCEKLGSLSMANYDLQGFGEDILRVLNEEGYFYMDLSGNIIAGPFMDAEDFSCGYGLVEVETDWGSVYTYIDKNGKSLSENGWLFQPEEGDPEQIEGFTYAESFKNGIACVGAVSLFDQYNVLTTENRFLFDFSILGNYNCNEEFILYSRGQHTEIYSLDGELLRRYPDKELQTMTIPCSPLLYDPANNQICNWKTDETFDGFEGLEPIIVLYAEDFPYYVFRGDEYVVTDEEMNVLYRLNEDTYECRDAGTGKYYFEEYTAEGSRLIIPHLGIDTDGISAEEMLVYHDLIMCLDEESCRYYNGDKELIFSYSFADETDK